MKNLGDQDALVIEREAGSAGPEFARQWVELQSQGRPFEQGVLRRKAATGQWATREAVVGKKQCTERAFPEAGQPAAERAARLAWQYRMGENQWFAVTVQGDFADIGQLVRIKAKDRGFVGGWAVQ